MFWRWVGATDRRWKCWQRRSTLLFGVNSHAFRKFARTRGRFFYCRAQFFLGGGRTFGEHKVTFFLTGSRGGRRTFPIPPPSFSPKPFFPPLRHRTPRGARVSTQCSHIVVATRRHFSFLSLRANEAGESPAVAVGGLFLRGWHQTLFVCPAACL